VGWPDLAAAAVHRRGDIEALIVDSGGEGSSLVHRLAGADSDASAVPDHGVGAAAMVSDVVIIEALAAGPTGVVAAAGSHAAAAVARGAGIPVWAVAGVGRVLPGRLWEAMLFRLDERGDEPWDRAEELVPAELVDLVVGPVGRESPEVALNRPSCPVAPELLRHAG
jgi:translation initiation factor 2B subunit (eIF-2B alpha/beta/delta family)